MVAALGGVYECNPTPINDPNSEPAPGRGHPPADPGPGARLRPCQVHPRRRQRPGADRPPAGVHVVAGQPGEERAPRPDRDLRLPRRDHEVADDRQPARRYHRPLQPGRVAARHPVEQDRLLHDPELPARRRRTRATRRTSCGRSRKTTRSSPPSATTCPRAARCSPRPPSSTKTSIAAGLSAGSQHLVSPSSADRQAAGNAEASTAASAKPAPTTSPPSSPSPIQARTANQSICAG